MNTITFQFAVVRYIHDPVTKEFLNIGVVLYSKEERYLRIAINKRYRRVSKTFTTIDRNHYNRMISSVENSVNQLSAELGKSGFFDQYPDSIKDMLARAVSPDDSSIRFDGFGGGLAHDLDSEFERLFSRLVTRYEGRKESESRSDDQVWHDYAKLFSEFQIAEHLQSKQLGTDSYRYLFSHAYKNDRWHPVESVSLDLTDPGYIMEKANKWIGRAMLLSDSEEMGTLHLLLGAPNRPELHGAYLIAAHNLETKIADLNVKVVREENSKEFTQEFSQFIKEHSDSA